MRNSREKKFSFFFLVLKKFFFYRETSLTILGSFSCVQGKLFIKNFRHSNLTIGQYINYAFNTHFLVLNH